MGIGVRAVDTAGVRMSVRAESRREISCRRCGYGAVVMHPLTGCPMCGGHDWRVVPNGYNRDSGRRLP